MTIDSVVSQDCSAIAEHLRNRYLRRVDWRFLLPNPLPQKIVCFSPGTMARAVAIISSHSVSPDSRPDDCNLAVAVNPAAETLRAAWRSLKPGGHCYTEWYGPWPAAPVRIRGALRAAGFCGVVCYWAWPWPSQSKSKFWINLEAPGAVRHFLASRPEPQAGRWVAVLLRLAWHMAARMHLLFPLCVVAQKPGSRGPDADSNARAATADTSGPAPLATIRQRWPEWYGESAPARLSWSLITGGASSSNKVVGLVFAEPDPQPRLAVKMARVVGSATALYREAAVLAAVHSDSNRARAGIPRVLFCEKIEGVDTLAETALTGMPLHHLLRRKNYRSYSLQAMDWLYALAGRATLSPRTQWWDRLAAPVLRDFEENFGDAVDSAMRRDAEGLVRDMDAMPLACEQRDFSPWNILVQNHGELAVLDWESAELSGFAGLDAIYFLTFAVFFLDGTIGSPRCSESYRAMLNPTTFTGRIASDCMRFYAERTGLSPAALPSLRAFAWILHSRSEYRHLFSETGSRPAREKLRGSVFVRLLETELRYGT